MYSVTMVCLTCVGPGAKKGQLEVTFFVKEKSRLHLGVSAHAGTQSGDAVSEIHDIVVCGGEHFGHC